MFFEKSQGQVKTGSEGTLPVSSRLYAVLLVCPPPFTDEETEA